MPILDFIVAIALGGLSFLLLLNYRSQKQVMQQLDDAFYELLKLENGQISLIELATASRVDAQTTRDYLQRQAKVFDATLEVDADGDTFYRFPKLHQ